MIDESPSVTVIILNYNGLTDTRLCLASVLESNYQNFLVVVADNGSREDETIALKQELRDQRITWKRFATNLGFAGANNVIIRESTSPYVVLLNNDTIVDKDWLSNLVDVMEQDMQIAACQGKILSLQHRTFFDYAGAAGGLMDQLGYPYARGRMGFAMEEDINQYNTLADIFWASGAAVILRRDTCIKVGLLPEEFFFYHEETDLCWRLKDAGYRIVFTPKALVYHKGAGSSRSSRRELQKRIFWVHRNALLLIARNMSMTRLWWVLPTRLILDWFSIIYYMTTGKLPFVTSVILAHLSFAKRTISLIRYRQKRKIPFGLAEKALHPLSIHWDYFIRRKKRYGDLIGQSVPSKIILYQQALLYPQSDKSQSNP